MARTALITGATSGIGMATALRLAKDGYRVIITGRRAERLHDLAERIGREGGGEVLPLCFDIRSRQAVEAAVAGLPESWREIDILINNAGLAAGLAPLDAGEIEDWERMIDTNIKGLLYITRTIAPQMKARRSGHIINLSSIAGREAYPNGNVYCGTKHAVEAIGKGLRMDLVPYGVKVTQICPGAVETEFSLVRFHGDQERADKVYEGFVPLRAEDIADTIAYALSLPSHVCINDMLIMPTAQASAMMTHREI